jgi:hypothetical protein
MERRQTNMKFSWGKENLDYFIYENGINEKELEIKEIQTDIQIVQKSGGTYYLLQLDFLFLLRTCKISGTLSQEVQPLPETKVELDTFFKGQIPAKEFKRQLFASLFHTLKYLVNSVTKITFDEKEMFSDFTESNDS